MRTSDMQIFLVRKKIVRNKINQRRNGRVPGKEVAGRQKRENRVLLGSRGLVVLRESWQKVALLTWRQRRLAGQKGRGSKDKKFVAIAASRDTINALAISDHCRWELARAKDRSSRACVKGRL
jgi:hypothetical protein